MMINKYFTTTDSDQCNGVTSIKHMAKPKSASIEDNDYCRVVCWWCNQISTFWNLVRTDDNCVELQQMQEKLWSKQTAYCYRPNYVRTTLLRLPHSVYSSELAPMYIILKHLDHFLKEWLWNDLIQQFTTGVWDFTFWKTWFVIKCGIHYEKGQLLLVKAQRSYWWLFWL